MTDSQSLAAEPSATTWRIGENVPWTAAWTSEGRYDLAPSEHFPGRIELIQISSPGEGTPVFDGMHVMRQRAGVVSRLCQVCGQPTPKHDRYIFPTVTGIFQPYKNGQLRYASHMPPTHLACATKAQRMCPHLRITLAKPVRWPDKVEEIGCETNPPPKMQALAAQHLPPGRKVVFSYFQFHTASFTRLVQRLREAEEAAPA
jgi:hypothetical protein